jgi:hypothetical protein
MNSIYKALLKLMIVPAGTGESANYSMKDVPRELGHKISFLEKIIRLIRIGMEFLIHYLPVLLYVAATSGTAAKMVVLEIGARKLQKERSATITTFREFGSRS